jgi:NSS family neurotransmitter:Na+ symporter
MSVLSFNVVRDWHPLGLLPGFQQASFYDVLDHLTSNLMLPIAGLLMAYFTGQLIPERFLRDELALTPFLGWFLHLLLRCVVVPAILIATLGPLLV